MSRLSRRVVLASSLSLSLPWIGKSAHSQNQFPKPIKIGHMGDFSSLYASYSGPVSETCTRFAVADFQAKNPSIAVEVLVADHQTKPDIASAIAQRWIDQDGVDAITDVPLSSCVFAVQEVVKNKNKMMLGANGNSPRITNENCSITSVHWSYSSQAQGNAAINAMFAQGAKTFFFLTTDNATGQGSEQAATALINAKGGKVIGGVRHPFGETDFSSFLVSAQASKADVIVLANAGPDLVNSVKTANEYKVTQKLCSLQCSINDIHGMGLQIAQGMGFTEGWYWDMDADARAFGQRVFAKHNVMPGAVQAACYSVVAHYLNAVKAVGTTDPTAVTPQMRKTRVNDMFAKNAYLREDGRLVHDLLFVRAKQPAQSKGPWDYMEIMNTIPGDVAFPLSETTCPLVKKT